MWLKDRGLMKWNGFFMPEHIEMLKQIQKDYYKLPRPILDDGQIEEIEQVLLISFENVC